MIKWRIDKNNKIPFYLQLKELIIYNISTGEILDNHQLPGVNVLGSELGINFETVRKAYKELEKQGLLKMERGRGTYVTLQNGSLPKKRPAIVNDKSPRELVKASVRELLQKGISKKKIQEMLENIFDEIKEESTQQIILFTECNNYQVKEFSKILSSYLDLNVKPVLLKNIKKESEKILKNNIEKLSIITTGFHINEVRNMFKNSQVKVHALIMSMSPETRLKLQNFDRNSNFAFVCRDQESIAFWADLLKYELGNDINLSCCIMEDESRLNEILRSSDVLLASPPVYESVKRIAPAELPVFNVFDKVDIMSMRLIKDRILDYS